ncbi:hypothetical protein Taro_002232 [Colocasia esculenta]|uniref:Uncharacterized protein n=1 Tax=Colocasia esculenta TaxID=4460 RepID=A0A843TI63_COLES|nr:hypothetical protein [Colocasia esculenta]
MSGRSHHTTSTEHSFTSTPEKTGTQCTMRNRYPQRVQAPQRVKPQPTNLYTQATTTGKARVGKNDATTRERTTGS